LTESARNPGIRAEEPDTFMSTTPPTLSELVMQHVAASTSRRVRDLAVEVRPDRVTLRGRAGSFHVKQLAQHGAREIVPTLRLENAIVVE
jgi:hypothetical protein